MDEAIATILAGGQSRRMGRAKATVELAGRPLIAYPLAAAAGLDPIVVAKPDSELPELNCAVVFEVEERSHPLAGVIAALGASAGRPIVAIGCDMPFLTPELLRWLAEMPEPLVVPEIGGRLQPLLARYAPALVDRLGPAIDMEEPLHVALGRLGPRIVGERELMRFGDPERLFFNVNSPADLQVAEKLLASGSTSTSAL
jgi:molybdopterin-guanine dinucleotide biosynthesis protein A